MFELRQSALKALHTPGPNAKVAAVQGLQLHYTQTPVLDQHTNLVRQRVAADLPDIRPERPHLVAPQSLKQRSLATPAGRATMLHAICHIEFNAINLALDAIWRFHGMPERYYSDWLQVAAEEAMHFGLVRARLQSLNHDYGDMPAHNGLWEMAEKTHHDVLARMALVPRVLEARGLDVNPLIREKFAQIGDAETCTILDIILRDEIGHVGIGNHWFYWLCQQANQEPQSVFQTLCQQYRAPALKKPVNATARLAAGFTVQELQHMGVATP